VRATIPLGLAVAGEIISVSESVRYQDSYLHWNLLLVQVYPLKRKNKDNSVAKYP
jgi:hypothetical protein